MADNGNSVSIGAGGVRGRCRGGRRRCAAVRAGHGRGNAPEAGQKAREGRDKAEEFAREGREFVERQRENMATAVERGREAFEQARKEVV